MSKYHNVRVEGFDSKAELARYRELQLLQKGRQITDLKRQVPFDLAIGAMLICRYRADFVYFDVKRSEWIVEDVKGVKTAVYNLKKKMMRHILGIEIQEVAA